MSLENMGTSMGGWNCDPVSVSLKSYVQKGRAFDVILYVLRLPFSSNTLSHSDSRTTSDSMSNVSWNRSDFVLEFLEVLDEFAEPFESRVGVGCLSKLSELDIFRMSDR